MADINRVRVALTGFAGGPGVSTFYCAEPATFVPLLRAFYNARANDFPDDLTIAVAGSGDVINDVNGQLTGTWLASTPAVVVGASTGSYAAPAGLTVAWNTSSISDGSRLRGRTFMVPILSTLYTTNGSLVEINRAAFEDDANVILDTSPGNLLVWRRPREARAATDDLPALTQRDGMSAAATSATVKNTVAILRSRRD